MCIDLWAFCLKQNILSRLFSCKSHNKLYRCSIQLTYSTVYFRMRSSTLPVLTGVITEGGYPMNKAKGSRQLSSGIRAIIFVVICSLAANVGPIAQNIVDEVSADFSGPPAAPIGAIFGAPPGDRGITSEAPSQLRTSRLQARFNF